MHPPPHHGQTSSDSKSEENTVCRINLCKLRAWQNKAQSWQLTEGVIKGQGNCTSSSLASISIPSRTARSRCITLSSSSCSARSAARSSLRFLTFSISACATSHTEPCSRRIIYPHSDNNSEEQLAGEISTAILAGICVAWSRQITSYCHLSGGLYRSLCLF